MEPASLQILASSISQYPGNTLTRSHYTLQLFLEADYSHLESIFDKPRKTNTPVNDVDT